MSELPLASCVIQPHLQQPLLFQSEFDSKYIADDDKLWRGFAIQAIIHWTIDLEITKLIYRSNETQGAISWVSVGNSMIDGDASRVCSEGCLDLRLSG
ncbi:hypothetical protein llap_5345 [Limosa lapponica baueri]|uniref:Uncharacterized protein n=1 Tax=Limosa lapponica baueri TaxID=1758121 RepID=A0A2I0UE83_LIMLA|nr:hypothetical protein llap_5345 [Limosa lapponica baueri]